MKRLIRHSCLWGDSDQRLSFLFWRGNRVERGDEKADKIYGYG